MSDFGEIFDREATASHVELSPAGAARREAMLVELKEAVHRRRFRRRAARAAALALLIAAPAAVFLLKPAWRDIGEPPPAGVQAAFPAAPFLHLQNARLEILDDDQLLALLAQAGRPAGLVRVGDRVFLTGNCP